MAGFQGELTGRRGGWGGAVFVVVIVALMAYLTFAALQGEHGLFRLFQIEAQEKRLQLELDKLVAEREAIANKTHRLSSATLDPELLDEQARRTLRLGRPDEMLIR